MVAPHCHDTVRHIEERLCQLALYVPGRISAMLQESGTHDGMDRLWLGLDPGRPNAIHTLQTKILLERILRCQASKNVACANKENRLHFIVGHDRLTVAPSTAG